MWGLEAGFFFLSMHTGTAKGEALQKAEARGGGRGSSDETGNRDNGKRERKCVCGKAGCQSRVGGAVVQCKLTTAGGEEG